MPTNRQKKMFLFNQGGAALWYESGGAPTPIAAWQPKGAADLATSYLNLVNPGTYDAAPGTAPTLHANGWAAVGSAYLTTGLVPAGLDWTMLARFSSVPNAAVGIMGCYQGATQCFMFRHTTDNLNFYNGANIYDNQGAFAAGVAGMAGKDTYRDGVDTGTIGAGGSNPSIEIYLMCYNMNGSATAILSSGYFAAAAVWNSTLTTDQVLAVSTAMAAL